MPSSAHLYMRPKRCTISTAHLHLQVRGCRERGRRHLQGGRQDRPLRLCTNRGVQRQPGAWLPCRAACNAHMYAMRSAFAMPPASPRCPRSPNRLSCVQCATLAPPKVSELRQRNAKSTDSASSSRNASKSLPGKCCVRVYVCGACCCSTGTWVVRLTSASHQPFTPCR